MADYERMSREELIAALRKAEADSSLSMNEEEWNECVADDALKWVVAHDDHRCLAVNRAALDCFGMARDAFLAQSFEDFFPSCAQAETLAPGVRRCRDSKGGICTFRYCEVDLHYAGRRARLLVASDISAALETKADLERFKEWMQRSQDYAHFGIWDWDIRSGVTLVSEQIGPLFGDDSGALQTTREYFLNAVHPEDRPRVIEAIRDTARCDDGYLNCAGDDCRNAFDIEYRIVHPDGSVRWIHERGGIERCERGLPARVLGVVQDITPRKQSEQALQESEQHFRLFAENIREMIWVTSPDFSTILYANQACGDILGMRREDAEPPQWEKIVDPDDLPLVHAALDQQARGEPAEVETRILRPDGKIRWIRVRTFPVHNAQGERMASGIAEDITDRKQLEVERINQMMAQRTNLVREVHHRIKNNLQGVAGLLRQFGNEHPEVNGIIDQAIAQVETVAVVHGLQGKMADNEVVLCEMVPTISRMVEGLLPSRPVINVTVDVPQRIRVNEQEAVPIALILNELIMNAAKHARADGIRICISVRWNALQSRGVISIVNPGTLPRGFEFDSGRHTGTGLDLVRALLPAQGGMLRYASSDNQVEAVLELSAPCIYNL